MNTEGIDIVRTLNGIDNNEFEEMKKYMEMVAEHVHFRQENLIEDIEENIKNIVVGSREGREELLEKGLEGFGLGGEYRYYREEDVHHVRLELLIRSLRYVVPDRIEYEETPYWFDKEMYEVLGNIKVEFMDRVGRGLYTLNEIEDINCKIRKIEDVIRNSN